MILKKVTKGDRGEVRLEAKEVLPGVFLAVRPEGLGEDREVKAEGPTVSPEVPEERQALRDRMIVC